MVRADDYTDATQEVFMALEQYDSDALRQYRAKAIELGDLHASLRGTLEQLNPTEAQAEFEWFAVRSKELDDLRAQLKPEELFMAKYSIVVVNDHTVSFVIPQGVSRIELLSEANALIKGRPLFHPQVFEGWTRTTSFTTPLQRTERGCIDGHEEGLKGKALDDLRALLQKHGLQLATSEDLAVAFAAFYVATGHSIFGSFRPGWKCAVHSQTHSFWVAPNGMCVSNIVAKQPHISSGASARVPLESVLSGDTIKISDAISEPRESFVQKVRRLFRV
jgi:hypothetical protein